MLAYVLSYRGLKQIFIYGIFMFLYVNTNIYVHCKQKMAIAGQKLDERIYFWHVEIVFKKVPFYVRNVHDCKVLERYIYICNIYT